MLCEMALSFIAGILVGHIAEKVYWNWRRKKNLEKYIKQMPLMNDTVDQSYRWNNEDNEGRY